MKFRDKAYNECLKELQQEFNKLNLITDNIETSLKKITNTTNWSSQTRNEFYSDETKLLNNFDNIYDKIVNILAYLQNVYDNYSTTESNLLSKISSIFNF